MKVDERDIAGGAGLGGSFDPSDAGEWAAFLEEWRGVSSTAHAEMLERLLVALAHCRAPRAALAPVDEFLLASLPGAVAPSKRETIVACIIERARHFIWMHDWSGLAALLFPLNDLIDSPVLRHVKSSVTPAINFACEETLNVFTSQGSPLDPVNIDERRQVVRALGMNFGAVIIERLKTAGSRTDRERMLSLLDAFGAELQPLLVRELRAANPWFLYRNLLRVLGGLGSADALGAICEKFRHPDPRVRAEAVTAAARIARDKAQPYLIEALHDVNEEVREHAAENAGLCPNPPMLAALRGRLKTRESERVLLAACRSLGHFTEQAATDVLLRIIHPPLLARYGMRRDPIRCAAIETIAKRLPNPEIERALERALRDRSPQVRETARRALGADRISAA